MEMLARAILFSWLAICAGCGGGDPASLPSDGGTDLDSDGDSDTDADGDTDSDTDTDTEDDPPDARPPTTLLLTIAGQAPETDQTGSGAVDRSLWGLVEEGPGEPWLPADDLGVGDPGATPLGEPSSVAYIWQVTDAQIVDEESPARLINGDFYEQTAFRNHDPWSTLFLEGAIRIANDFSYFRRFDFALATGDMIDNIHRNELGWYLAVMDGDLVDPDSGDDDDPLPGDENDPHDPFLAEGLDPSIPWYVTEGNHDLLELGNGPLVSWMLADPTGDTASWLSAAVVPTCLEEPWYEDESPSPPRCYLPPKGEYSSKSVVPDPDREFIDHYEWLEGHFDTSTSPDGHGYTDDNLAAVFGGYAVEDAIEGLPVSLISIDMVSESGQWGTFDAARWTWLDTRLAEAEEAGRAVIVASHHTGNSLDDENEREQLIALLNEYPNVIAHIGGHTHLNRITPRPAPAGYGAEHGYWEIETSSTMDWPQQTRLIEIVDNRDGTGDIYCTMVDYVIPEGLAALEGGRFYALWDVQSGGVPSGKGGPGDRNAILRFRWPDDLADALALLPHREVESFNFPTSL